MKRKDIKSKPSIAHGGAWKVAYADFVTGMMSLFLVLWILSQDEEVIIATTRFFRDPYKAGVPKSTPVEQKDARPGSMVDQIVGRSDTTMRNTDDTTSIDIDVLHRIAQDWYQRLKLHEMDKKFSGFAIHTHDLNLWSPLFLIDDLSGLLCTYNYLCTRRVSFRR